MGECCHGDGGRGGQQGGRRGGGRGDAIGFCLYSLQWRPLEGSPILFTTPVYLRTAHCSRNNTNMQTQTHSYKHKHTLLHTNTLLHTHKQTGYQKYIKMRGCAYFLHFKIFNSFVWGVRWLFICLLCKMFVYYPSRVCGGVEGGCLSVYCPHNFVSSSTRPTRPDQAHDSKEMRAKKGKRGEKNILNKAIKDGDISFLIIWPYESIYGLKLKLKF